MTRICSLVVGLVSALIMSSWLLGWRTPLLLFPPSPPMAFNSAFCLFLLSLGGLFPQSPWLRKAWIPALALSLLTCLQYLFGIELGLDEIFVSEYTWRFLGQQGRMPAPAAFCLMIASFGQAAYFQYRPKNTFPWSLIALICAAVVTFLGVAGAVYYIATVSTRMFWGNFAKMSLITACCLILYGTAGIQENSMLLSFKHASRWKIAGVLCGMGLFLLSFLSWEMKLMENSSRTAGLIQVQVEGKSRGLRQEFERLALTFQRTKMPANRIRAERLNWVPPIENTRAVIRLSSRPELIWSDGMVSEKDLKLLADQVHRDPGFHFYESLAFQRSRLMGFGQNGYLLVFSPHLLITHFFPPQEFLYSLHSKEQILFSNATNLPRVLKEWEMDCPLGLWSSHLTLELSPTRKTLSSLGASSYVPFLLAGMALSLAAGVILSSIPNWRQRFSH